MAKSVAGKKSKSLSKSVKNNWIKSLILWMRLVVLRDSEKYTQCAYHAIFGRIYAMRSGKSDIIRTPIPI